MSEDGVKLIGECNKDRLPNYVEKLITSVRAELQDTLTDYDLTVVILFGLMAETGFTPLGVDDVLTGPMSPYGSTYDSKKLNAIQKMPKNWRNATGGSYSMKFHLNPCHESVCQFIASKIEATTSDSIDDNLIVNLFVNCSTSADAINIQPSKYVASKNAEIPNMFDKLDELSALFKNVVHPIRNAILEENGKLNASLIGIPTEVKLKIFGYLTVPEGWRALSETCMDFHILGNDQKLWKTYLKRDFGTTGSYKPAVDELFNSAKNVDWKMEYLGRFFYDYCKSNLEEGRPEPFWLQSPTTSRFLVDVQYIVSQNFPAWATESEVSFDPDAWSDDYTGTDTDTDDADDEFEQTNHDLNDSSQTALGECANRFQKRFPSDIRREQSIKEGHAKPTLNQLNVDVIYKANLNENEPTSEQPSVSSTKSINGGVFCTGTVAKVHEDSKLSPDSLADTIGDVSSTASEASSVLSFGSGVKKCKSSTDLLFNVQQDEDGDVYDADAESNGADAEFGVGRSREDVAADWVRAKMATLRSPFDSDDGDDTSAVSLHNNLGSEPDLDGVGVIEMERKGNGDADFLECVVPGDYTYGDTDSQD